MLYLKWQQIFMGLKIYSAALMGSAWLQPPVGWQIRRQVYSKKERRETTTTTEREQKHNPQGTNSNAAHGVCAGRADTAGVWDCKPNAGPLKHPQIALLPLWRRK